MAEVAIGIDLGTTFCCMAVCINNEVTIIPNELGKSTTPSHVHIDEDENVTVGQAAKSQANFNPALTVFDVKRVIGRKYDDPVVQADIKLWPFQLIGEDNAPKVVLNGKSYYPEQISGFILSHLKKQAEEFLRCPVTKAVITVPAYFNDGQRQATKDAGKIAGLDVLRILNEPTAAAIAYCHLNTSEEKRNILVFDLGGGTFDIAVLTMEGHKIEIKAVGGDSHLGGQDFDKALVNYCLQEFEKENGINLQAGKYSFDEKERTRARKLLRRLKNECEQRKEDLATANTVFVSLDAVTVDLNLTVKVTRAIFEEINEELFQRCMLGVAAVLNDAKVGKQDIHEVIMVGGSSRIPKLREMVKDFFGGRQPHQIVKADEAVAYGAAVQAALMQYREKNSAKRKVSVDITIQDVVPLSIGISAFIRNTDKLEFFAIIPKNTPVPCRKVKKFETRWDNQRIVVRVFEGESSDPKKNHLLGEFAASHLPVGAKKGEPYDVVMAVNEEGILDVTASYRSTSLTDKLMLESLKGRLHQEKLIALQINPMSSFQTQ